MLESAVFFPAICVGAVASEPVVQTEQIDKEGWFCAQDCSGANFSKKNVKKAAEHNGRE